MIDRERLEALREELARVQSLGPCQEALGLLIDEVVAMQNVLDRVEADLAWAHRVREAEVQYADRLAQERPL